jgi:aspartyl/asparaginyl beta-hydroxylase (cupin superfamily)
MANIFQSAILRTTRHRSSPSMFSLPGLTARPWHRCELFEFTDVFRENLSSIKSEYANVSRKKSDYDDGGKDEHKLHKGGWDWHSYIQKGKKNDNFRDHCPKTCEILDSIPGLMTNIPFAYTFFSTLHPNASISAHTGPCNLRLRCHFPIHVPKGEMGLRVAGETKVWEEGEPLIFDDSFVHDAWNRSDSERVVLLFDFWHPEVYLDEREEIINMFQTAKEKGWMSS